MCESELEKKEPDVHSPDTEEVSALVPEEAILALSQITQIIEREEQNVSRNATDPEHPLAKPLSDKAKADLREVLKTLHPADVAYVLEALPPDDRLAVWQLCLHLHAVFCLQVPLKNFYTCVFSFSLWRQKHRNY